MRMTTRQVHYLHGPCGPTGLEINEDEIMQKTYPLLRPNPNINS